MKKKLLKFFIIIGALALLLTLISTTGVQAVTLQANPNTHYIKKHYSSDWITPFREMETTGGALGLSEIINETTLLSTSGSNNLDSHMVKSTEYGAAAILSTSGYGNSKRLQESTIKTTTGNETGVYFSGTNWEWVAAGVSGVVFKAVDERYYDAYATSQGTAKIGDALGTASTTNPGSAGWHLSKFQWVGGRANYIERGGLGLFSFGYCYNTVYYNYEWYGRGVVVCGEGL